MLCVYLSFVCVNVPAQSAGSLEGERDGPTSSRTGMDEGQTGTVQSGENLEGHFDDPTALRTVMDESEYDMSDQPRSGKNDQSLIGKDQTRKTGIPDQ